MSTETEAKFIVPDPAAARQIRALTRLGSYALGEGRIQVVTDDYLDTTDRALLGAGYACRARDVDGKRTRELKSVTRAPDGESPLHRREEAEATPERLRDLVGDRPLGVLFSLRQERFVREIVEGGRSLALCSLDEVSLLMGAGSPQWTELEIELGPGGTEPDLAAMAGWVRATLHLPPAGTSKFERALRAVDSAGPGGVLPRRGHGRPADFRADSLTLEAPPGGATELPADSLAAMGYAVRVRRRVKDRVVFFDTHDASFTRKGYAVSWSESSSTWRLREGGRVQAEEEGPGGRVPLDGPIGAALGGIPADHPAVPLLEASLVESDYGISGVGSDPLRLRARQWTFRSPLVTVPEQRLLRMTLSGPAPALAYFAGLLQSQLAFRPSREPLLERGLSLLGISAPGAGVPRDLRVDAGDSLPQACRKILRGEAWRMRMNARGAARDLDPEFVHDLRVATRRSRSAIRLFAGLLGPEETGGLQDEFRWIAGLLGAVRDLDVLSTRLDVQLAMTGGSAELAGTIRGLIRSRRDRALAQLVPALESPRFAALVDRMESMVIAEAAAPEGAGSQSAGVFARKRIDKAFRKLVPWTDRPADSLDDGELHQIRILFKRLRYACEFFRGLLGEDGESLIRTLVSFQDCLGLHQDATTALRLLAQALEEVPAERRTEDLLLSVGSLLQVQRDIQQVQRKAFARRWESASQLLAAWRRARAAGSTASW